MTCTQSTTLTQSKVKGDVHSIYIYVQDKGDISTHGKQFKIKNTTPLRKLMDFYCSWKGVTCEQVRFTTYWVVSVESEDTASSLGIECDDTCYVSIVGQ